MSKLAILVLAVVCANLVVAGEYSSNQKTFFK